MVALEIVVENRVSAELSKKNSGQKRNAACKNRTIEKSFGEIDGAADLKFFVMVMSQNLC